VDGCILANGDRIRIGDTVLLFADHEDWSAERTLAAGDNGVVPNTCVQRQVAEAAETALKRLSDLDSPGDAAKQASALLNIGARLQKWQGREGWEVEILRQLLEIAPATIALETADAPAKSDSPASNTRSGAAIPDSPDR
jgi:hypothetical protein